MKHYYIRYEPKAEINYIYLLYLYSLGEYNTTKKCFDTISYSSIRALEKVIADRFGKGNISVSGISRMMNDERYREYFSVDKEKKVISLHNDIRGLNSFVMLSSSEVDFLLSEKDNLLGSDMKNVQIPYDLFVDLVLYHLRGEDDFDEDIRQGLEQKIDAMLSRQLYSQYKTAPTEEQREQARQEYLDRRGVPQSYRWTTPPWEL